MLNEVRIVLNELVLLIENYMSSFYPTSPVRITRQTKKIEQIYGARWSTLKSGKKLKYRRRVEELPRSTNMT